MQTRLARLAAKFAEWIRARLGLVDLGDELPPELPKPEPFVSLSSLSFGRLSSSSLWSDEPIEVRLVWLTLLTLADVDGIGHENVRAVAALANVGPDAAWRGFERLVELGRIELLDDSGWRITNMSRYQSARSAAAPAAS